MIKTCIHSAETLQTVCNCSIVVQFLSQSKSLFVHVKGIFKFAEDVIDFPTAARITAMNGYVAEQIRT